MYSFLDYFDPVIAIDAFQHDPTATRLEFFRVDHFDLAIR